MIEAISTGLPVICHDMRWLNMAINDLCGIKIPIRSGNESVKGIREAILRILANPDIVNSMSKAAIQGSSEITWQKLAEKIREGYNEVIQSGS